MHNFNAWLEIELNGMHFVRQILILFWLSDFPDFKLTVRVHLTFISVSTGPEKDRPVNMSLPGATIPFTPYFPWCFYHPGSSIDSINFLSLHDQDLRDRRGGKMWHAYWRFTSGCVNAWMLLILHLVKHHGLLLVMGKLMSFYRSIKVYFREEFSSVLLQL